MAKTPKDITLEIRGTGKVIWPDGTEISGQQFQDTIQMVEEAYQRGRKDGRAEITEKIHAAAEDAKEDVIFGSDHYHEHVVPVETIEKILGADNG